MFNDPLAVTRLQEAYLKEKQALEVAIKNKTVVEEQNNDIQDTTELQNQEQ